MQGDNTNTLLVDIPQIDPVVFFGWVFNILVKSVIFIYESLINIQGIVTGLSIPVMLVFVIGIIVSVERLKRIRKLEEEILYPDIEPSFDETENAIPDKSLSTKWNTVLSHIESENPNDWRQAIMEADIILDDILKNMGYRGDSIGERLKRVEKADFITIDEAWEAHKVRNAIAHEGSNYPLNKYEARRVINLYRRVFEEFYYI